MDFTMNPNPNYTPQLDPMTMTMADLELVNNYLKFDDGGGDDDISGGQELGYSSGSLVSSAKIFAGGSTTGSNNTAATATSRNYDIKCKNGVRKSKADVSHRIAFRTKSELEVMDDGFKWRKYGKKSVKNSPNPRNYYKCSSGECNVKKRVERDREDSSYVITTYEGIHNHESPAVYYNQMPVAVRNGWTLQPSSHSSSSS